MQFPRQSHNAKIRKLDQCRLSAEFQEIAAGSRLPMLDPISFHIWPNDKIETGSKNEMKVEEGKGGLGRKAGNKEERIRKLGREPE